MAIVVLEHSRLTGAGRLGEVLRDHGHRLRVIRLDEGEPLPPDLDDVDGVVTCGGGGSANDASREWLQGELEFLKAAHDAGRPIVGICLGSQILAVALGGAVGPLDGGIELGWHAVALNPVGCEDPLYAGLPWSSLQPHWHREQVTELPDGARLLASSSRCRVQAWTDGLRTYAFQYHPELAPESFDDWAEDEPGALQEAGMSLEQLRDQTREHHPTCARLAERLFERIALLLMPIDRRYKGLVRDLHH